MKIRSVLVLGAATLIAATACRDKSEPGYVYMPNMYYSTAGETYAATDQFADGTTAQSPVEGTIPRGFTPYEVPNTPEGYAYSFGNVSMPEAIAAADNAAEAEKLYTIFCAHCHGEKGDGNGILVKNEKILGVPSYAASRLPDITAGSIFHVITYGKGVMGSPASQLSPEERWKVVKHVLKLRADQAPQAEATPAAEATTQPGA